MPEALSHDIVAAAIKLTASIRAAHDALDAGRRVPPALVEALAQAGCLQLYLPSAIGGRQCPPLTTFRVIEELSRADGSVGWCCMISTATSLLSGWLRPDVAQAMFGDPPDARIAGSFRPEGKAYAVDGGYRVHGRWDFASGIQHATWLVCTCMVMDGDTPRHTPAGVPQTRVLMVPAKEATIIDTWSVVGMCGTGSHDFVVQDVFVPTTHTFSLADPPQAVGPLYHPRLFFVTTWTATVANALGIARGAMETFVALATQAHSTSSPTLLRDRPLVQTRVAEAEAILSAARAYVLTTVGAAWDAVGAGVAEPGPAIAQARLAITHGMHEAVRAVDLLFHAAGSNAVYRKHGLERSFRDVHAAVQHAAGLPGNLESAGKALLGLRPPDLGW